MCDTDRPGLPRRRFLAAGAAGSLGSLLIARAARAQPELTVEVADGLSIVTRSSWGPDLPPTGPLDAEAPGDVRFLLVHHTVNTNNYADGDTTGLLRTIYGLHTADRGWSDVAYNFFVDRFGVVFEGRTGSLERPIKGDATGGSQGFALLCAFVGDHRVEPPTPAATDSMVRLLAWLAETYRLDTQPGASTAFVSRGSNLHPAGVEVTTSTIAGHRDMSSTECPGDAAYGLVTDVLPAAVTQERGRQTVPTTAVPATTEPTPNSPSSTSTTRPTSTTEMAAGPARSQGDDRDWLLTTGLVGVALGAGTALLLRLRNRRNQRAS